MPFSRAVLAPFVLFFAVCGACHAPAHEAPPKGLGLVTFDRTPPAGAEVFAKPDWKAGDRFTYRKGKLLRLPYRVDADESGGWRLVEEETGLFLRIDADLGEHGQVDPRQNGRELVLDPGDVPYQWPLWVGKRWTCQFTLGPKDKPTMAVIVSYHCDAIEEVTVPAGTFRCVRIWRSMRPAREGRFVEQVAILWYAPDVGYFSRRIEDGVLTELEEFHRQ